MLLCLQDQRGDSNSSEHQSQAWEPSGGSSNATLSFLRISGKSQAWRIEMLKGFALMNH